MDVIIGYHQHAAVGGIFICRYRYRVVDIQRAVGGQRRRWPHGCGHDHRLTAVDHQVEEVARLLQGIGAVRDDDAIHVGLGGQRIHPLRQFQPNGVRHVLAAHVGYLFTGDIGNLLDLRNGIDQDIDTDLAGCVPRLGLAVSGPGYGAAGCKNDDIRFVSRLCLCGQHNKQQA